MNAVTAQTAENQSDSEGTSESKENTATDAAASGAQLESDAQSGDGTEGDQDRTEGGDIDVAATAIGHDADAPYGRFSNGNPRKSPGKAAVTQERGKQRAKLRSVTSSTARVKPTASSAPVTALAVVNYQAFGEQIAQLWFNVGQMIFGLDWAPDEKEGEPLAVEHAFRDYFKATQMSDLPPGVALVFVLSVYTLKRVNRPTIAGKLQAFGQWVKSKLHKRARG